MRSKDDHLHGEVIPGKGRGSVLLLHSLALDQTMWSDVVESIGSATTVLTCDLPGHGRSLRRRGTTIESMADAVADFIVAMQPPLPLTVCGLSLGGCVAQGLVINHPSLVQALCLVDTTAWYGIDAKSAWAERADRATKDGLGSLAQFQFERWFSRKFRTERPEVAERLLSIFVSMDLPAYNDACRAMGAMDFRGQLSQIRIPTSVVVGEMDPATPPAYARDLAERIEGSTLSVLPECSHLSPLERPDLFVPQLLDLLSHREIAVANVDGKAQK